MRYLSIRNIPDALGERLLEARRESGESLNTTVIELLSQALGVDGRKSNGLGALAGGWSRDEHQAFEHAIAVTEQVDEELWR